MSEAKAYTPEELAGLRDWPGTPDHRRWLATIAASASEVARLREACKAAEVMLRGARPLARDTTVLDAVITQVQAALAPPAGEKEGAS